MRIAPSLVPRTGVALGAVLMAAGLLGGTAAQAADGAPAAGAPAAAAPATAAAPASDANQTVVQGGSVLNRGQNWSSPDGSTVLYQQYDGHVVLYKNNVAVWTAVGTHGIGTYFQMQYDGNLVAYDAAWRAVWNSRTMNYPGAYLAVQNGGNIVVYYGSTPVWWSNYRPGGTGPVDPDPECTPTTHQLCP
ncbi:D-mannose binding lectin [Streptomyces sp. TLI_053]|uniref:hypothetical protein n=1 Tax=Streptomyces sp. TLI_053 TaxID=1855352 RepID=UPI00087AB9F3|nr:hypothetical protein [Streptomyces sp. TLI_053]SDS86179.1 D-mannose binding lectin [Streptomyces sp. TLI_053]